MSLIILILLAVSGFGSRIPLRPQIAQGAMVQCLKRLLADQDDPGPLFLSLGIKVVGIT